MSVSSSSGLFVPERSAGPPTGRRVAVLSRSWRPTDAPKPLAGAALAEQRAAVRSLAGALSRCAAVDVLVPGPGGSSRADGAFDTAGIGPSAPGGHWPAPGALGCAEGHRWDAVVVDAGDDGAVLVSRALAPGAPVLAVGRSVPGAGAAEGISALLDVGTDGGASDDQGRRRHAVGLYARVHPYAAERRHHELGEVRDYVLVLSAGGGGRPEDETSWLLARCARRHVVVVDDAVAHLWRSRSRLYGFEVHSRMDLWRLMAHAWATVDLAPGPLYGRECVEALRYGVPVVAPAGSSVDGLARQGALTSFRGSAGLVRSIGALEDPGTRARMGAAGKAVADRWYGDPEALVRRVADALCAHTAR